MLDNLLKLKTEIASMDRNALFNKTNKKKDQMEMAFITGFNTQYKAFEHILKKYWPILKEDRVLSKILPNRPKFVYRRAPTLRN